MLQIGVGSWQSPLAAHWTQTLLFVSQTGVGSLQFESAVHATQVWVFVSQAGFEPLQLEFAVHSTHVWVLTSHAGVLPEHCEFELQAPGGSWHVFVAIVHFPPVPQSMSEKHSTQVPRPVQNGFDGSLQSRATSHSTHCPAVLQMGFPVLAQSAAVRHCTQMPLAVAQKGVGAAQLVLEVQELVHWRAVTLHFWPALQLVSERQATHRARVTSHTGVGALHGAPQFAGTPPVPGSAPPAPLASAPPLDEAASGGGPPPAPESS